MPAQIRPLRDKLIVKPTERASVTKGGIIIPDNAKEPTFIGEVVAIGPGWSCPSCGDCQPMSGIKVGDKVLFAKYTKNSFKHEGVELHALRYEHVYIVIEED